MNQRKFSDLMVGMLRKLGLSLPADLQKSNNCTISYQQLPDVHFVNQSPQFIDVISHLGILSSEFEPEKSIHLLALNSVENDQPLIAVTVHPPTKTVSLLTRQNIHETNVSTLLQLTELIYKKNEMVKAIFSI